MLGENKWSHYCRQPILSFNATRRERKRREMINKLITFWLYPGWLICFYYLRLIYYTNWNFLYTSNSIFFLVLTIIITCSKTNISSHCRTISNPFELMFYTQWKNKIGIIRENRQRNQVSKHINDDEWINYPPTLITVGYPVTITKRWIMLFPDMPTYFLTRKSWSTDSYDIEGKKEKVFICNRHEILETTGHRQSASWFYKETYLFS